MLRIPSLRAALAHIAEEALDDVYPPLCPLCAQWAEPGPGCAEHSLPAAPPGPRCGRCAAALAPVLPDGEPCPDCRREPPDFARVIALGDYASDAGLREWILAFKHRNRPDLALPLGRALAQRWAAERAHKTAAERADAALEPALLVPVPLHFERRLERGYDQAWLLARATAEAAGLRTARCLWRTRPTLRQGDPRAPSRASNVAGAFRRVPWRARHVRGAELWLVDDVLTSGATATECARVLRGLRPRSIGVLCLARA